MLKFKKYVQILKEQRDISFMGINDFEPYKWWLGKINNEEDWIRFKQQCDEIEKDNGTFIKSLINSLEQGNSAVATVDTSPSGKFYAEYGRARPDGASGVQPGDVGSGELALATLFNLKGVQFNSNFTSPIVATGGQGKNVDFQFIIDGKLINADVKSDSDKITDITKVIQNANVEGPITDKLHTLYSLGPALKSFVDMIGEDKAKSMGLNLEWKDQYMQAGEIRPWTLLQLCLDASKVALPEVINQMRIKLSDISNILTVLEESFADRNRVAGAMWNPSPRTLGGDVGSIKSRIADLFREIAKQAFLNKMGERGFIISCPSRLNRVVIKYFSVDKLMDKNIFTDDKIVRKLPAAPIYLGNVNLKVTSKFWEIHDGKD